MFTHESERLIKDSIERCWKAATALANRTTDSSVDFVETAHTLTEAAKLMEFHALPLFEKEKAQ